MVLAGHFSWKCYLSSFHLSCGIKSHWCYPIAAVFLNCYFNLASDLAQWVSINGLLFRLNITRWAKLNSLLFLVALRDSVRSQAKIVAVVRKPFGTTTKLRLGVGSVILSFVKSILTRVPQHSDQKAIDEAAISLASPLCALALKLLKVLKPPSYAVELAFYSNSNLC